MFVFSEFWRAEIHIKEYINWIPQHIARTRTRLYIELNAKNMKLSNRNGYKTLYIRLIWQFIVFIVVINMFAVIYQTIEKYSDPYSDDGEVMTQDGALKNFSSVHNVSYLHVSAFLRQYEEIKRPDHENDMEYLEAVVLAISVFYTIGKE